MSKELQQVQDSIEVLVEFAMMMEKGFKGLGIIRFYKGCKSLVKEARKIKETKEAWKSLNQAERFRLRDFAASKFDLKNDDAEEKIEKIVKVFLDIKDIVKDIKEVKS